ncbi:MAG: TIGR03619 family F420-dependent LLM class oxidoreductase [Thermodesulfobacteriales bacterium]|jgi:probable F420-dependent oxidoreductase|nr:MAG: TIGR03619 family F420-dependent LLM class oxidoreductase [Thermodesulfobacteriales bacterium]
MNFGITLPNFGKYADKNEILNIATAAQELGFDSIWVSDHIVIPDTHKGFGDVFYEPIVTLSYLASITKGIKLGSSVIILPYRNPVVLAKMVSTLDQLSGARVILGIGAGWLEKEFQALGVPYSDRGEMTDEFLKVLKTLWTQENPSFNGKYFNFSDIKFLPKPVQKPYPPIWIGGGSDKAIERAATYGDGWHPVGLTPEKLKERLNHLNKLLTNQKKENFTISLRRNLEINNDKTISPDDTLRGSIEKIVKGIKDYKELGVNHLILHFLSGTSEGVLNTMKRFSNEIRTQI